MKANTQAISAVTSISLDQLSKVSGGVKCKPFNGPLSKAPRLSEKEVLEQMIACAFRPNPDPGII